MCDIRSSRSPGFTLIELLVVIGIIALLLALLLPSLTKSKQNADRVKCLSNLRAVGQASMIYAANNRGFFIPVGPLRPDNKRSTFGTNVASHLRWPVKFFPDFKIPNPLPYNPTDYRDPPDTATWGDIFSAKPFTPPVLVCPSDFEPAEYHSYVLNQHLDYEKIKQGAKVLTSLTILAGEKKTSQRDYHMENTMSAEGDEFARVVELYRHGLKLGSNYLYLDGHADNQLNVDKVKAGIDPWTVGSSTRPSTP
jgi:prepilin-type N-terminal cleavage/methylation domain-containing protein/prepilin-type processing-associated H-X9-DG protein